jgi:ADP-ribose pyrophosphatase
MSKIKNPWNILKEETVLSYPIFDVKKSLRRNPATEAEFEFLLVRGLDWVNVISFISEKEVVMVRQYRHGVEDFTLEFPGGCIEKGEEPQVAALRELSEETGYTTESNLEYLGMVQANPAMYSMKNYFYIARNCKKTRKQNLDQGEDVEIIIKPYAELLSEVNKGKFLHGLCTAAIGLHEMKKRS